MQKNVFLTFLFTMVLYQSSTLVLSAAKHFKNTNKYTEIYTHRYLYNCVHNVFRTWKATPAKPS